MAADLIPPIALAEPPLGQVDWSGPALRHLQERAQPLAQGILAGHSVWQVLDEAAGAAGAPVRFVPQQALPAGVAYEAYIRAEGAVPTRDGWHDFLNGLVWLHFPATKQRLNALQSRVIAEQGVGGVRGPVRDACTVFDENGALLQVSDDLWDALCARDWRRLFLDLRQGWNSGDHEASSRVTLFGHALMEKLLRPRKDITAHVLRVPLSVRAGELDAWLANELTPQLLAVKPFQPLPVLGVPGWCADNEHPDFYDDARVFRHPRQSVE